MRLFTRGHSRAYLWPLSVVLTVLLAFAAYGQAAGSRMVVIAPSFSTREVARSLLREKAWFETTPKRADAVLVVVRSSLSNPLGTFGKECFCDLKKAAERQPNLTGSKFHIYVYRLDDDLTVTRLKHWTKDAK